MDGGLGTRRPQPERILHQPGSERDLFDERVPHGGSGLHPSTRRTDRCPVLDVGLRALREAEVRRAEPPVARRAHQRLALPHHLREDRLVTGDLPRIALRRGGQSFKDPLEQDRPPHQIEASSSAIGEDLPEHIPGRSNNFPVDGPRELHRRFVESGDEPPVQHRSETRPGLRQGRDGGAKPSECASTVSWRILAFPRETMDRWREKGRGVGSIGGVDNASVEQVVPVLRQRAPLPSGA